MPLPWLSIVDGVLGATDLVRRVTGGTGRGLANSGGAGLETRLAGVVVSALREAFDRDHERLEIERRRIEDERERAERAMRLELLRQSADREIARLRLMAGVTAASVLGTLFVASRALGGPLLPRVMLGGGWSLLVVALATSFSAQASVTRALGRADDRALTSEVTGSLAGMLTMWLIVAGLAAVVVGVLSL